ncbi:unnamed protein product, partial [Gongylonema pulchrum]|uniref:Tr-type G domain-containing protein n=1 Tax=Gongylonema pulchrum TaxID=637853 RepID=A0A183E042_9BILA
MNWHCGAPAVLASLLRNLRFCQAFNEYPGTFVVAGSFCLPNKIEKDYLIKLLLTGDDAVEKINRYCAYVQELVVEGGGEAVIDVGVTSDTCTERGMMERQLELAQEKHVELMRALGLITTRLVTETQRKFCNSAYLVRSQVTPDDFIEVRVAVVGNVDAGKSTLLGVLTHGALDDGRGQARQKLFRHKHEFESGRTSSVGNDILGFDAVGNVVNNPDSHTGNLDWLSICQQSAKVVTFFDLAGHEKYLKTTIFGMTGHVPEYAMLLIGANAGIVGMTKEHLSLALYLDIPIFIVVTKIDMCPEKVLAETMSSLEKLMKSRGARKFTVPIRRMEDVVRAATTFSAGTVCPVFQVSNVVGTNLDLLRAFLNLIPLRQKFEQNCPPHFQIDDVYWVDGVGTVVSGTCLAGVISLNDTMVIGPNLRGEFIPIPVKSIHRKRMAVRNIRSGQTASISIRKLSKKEVRKGMVLLSPQFPAISSIGFTADILVLHHPTTIAKNYQAMVHIGSVRQTATITGMQKPVLRTGDRDRVSFRFIRHPEYLCVGTQLVFREGRTKAVGKIQEIFPYIESTIPKQLRPKAAFK